MSVAERVDADAAQQVKIALACSSMMWTPSPRTKRMALRRTWKAAPRFGSFEFVRAVHLFNFISPQPPSLRCRGYAELHRSGSDAAASAGNSYALDAVQKSLAQALSLGNIRRR